jgi:GWxTD domain-containing protein
MKTLIKYFALLFVFAIPLSAQVENSGREGYFELIPKFYLDLANYKSDKPNRTRVDVFTQVPYSSIQFVRSKNNFIANYQITVTFYDEDEENVVVERIWKEKVSVNRFSKTTSKRSSNISYRSFYLPAGEYPVRVHVEDLDSKRSYKAEVKAKLRSFDDKTTASDIMLISEFIKSEDGNKVVPNVSHQVTSEDEELSFFYEIYSNKKNTVVTEYELKRKDDPDSTIYKKDIVKLQPGKNTIYKTLKDIKLTLGEYELYARVKSLEGDFLAGMKKNIFSKIYGLPGVVDNLHKAIEQMTYIASDDELDSIKAPEAYDKKLKRYKEYWASKDPSPNDNINEVLYEYYRRIAYANEHFESYYEGWKTDMGMVYVILGPPDNVERHPFELESKPYEIWDYYDVNKRFVFVDQTGFGDYRLLNPIYGDWYRYRQN